MNVWLIGVATEPSEPSGLDTDRARFFKLIDDLFFFKNGRVAGARWPPGDGTSPIEFNGNPGVAGDIVTIAG